jgi:cytochrome b pre-mRNA-processing protein 3
MLSAFFNRSSSTTSPQQLYGTVMTQARLPEFFTDFGIPDTVMGRFDVLSLHIYLLARRFREEGSPIAMDLSQEVFDLYVYDVERALRELGIGDTSVPKKKKKMIRSFYGQIDDFDEAINTSDAKEISAKAELRYLSETENPNPQILTSYILKTEAHLKDQPMKALLSGKVSWLSPEGFNA